MAVKLLLESVDLFLVFSLLLLQLLLETFNSLDPPVFSVPEALVLPVPAAEVAQLLAATTACRLGFRLP